jgi:nucleotide-binding universal stress UspA family protein
MSPIRTILHPTDFSEPSHYAFRLACALARDYNATLILMHVAGPPVVIGEGIVVPEFNSYLEQQLYNRLCAIRPDDSKVRVAYRMAQGDPAAEILEAVRATGSDLIVMGTHGRTWIARLLMGSVAQVVVRKAPCPVLTVRVPFPGAEPAEALTPFSAAEPAATTN